jgi:hypothetical protein
VRVWGDEDRFWEVLEGKEGVMYWFSGGERDVEEGSRCEKDCCFVVGVWVVEVEVD